MKTLSSLAIILGLNALACTQHVDVPANEKIVIVREVPTPVPAPAPSATDSQATAAPQPSTTGSDAGAPTQSSQPETDAGTSVVVPKHASCLYDSNVSKTKTVHTTGGYVMLNGGQDGFIANWFDAPLNSTSFHIVAQGYDNDGTSRFAAGTLPSTQMTEAFTRADQAFTLKGMSFIPLLTDMDGNMHWVRQIIDDQGNVLQNKISGQDWMYRTHLTQEGPYMVAYTQERNSSYEITHNGFSWKQLDTSTLTTPPSMLQLEHVEVERGHAFYPIGFEAHNGKLAFAGRYTVPNGDSYENRLTVSIYDTVSRTMVEQVIETSPTQSSDGLSSLVLGQALYAMEDGLVVVWQDYRPGATGLVKATHIDWDSHVGMTRDLFTGQLQGSIVPQVEQVKLNGETLLQMRFQSCVWDTLRSCTYVDVFGKDLSLKATYSYEGFRGDRIAASGSSFAISGWDMNLTADQNPNGYEDIRFYACE